MRSKSYSDHVPIDLALADEASTRATESHTLASSEGFSSEGESTGAEKRGCWIQAPGGKAPND